MAPIKKIKIVMVLSRHFIMSSWCLSTRFGDYFLLPYQCVWFASNKYPTTKVVTGALQKSDQLYQVFIMDDLALVSMKNAVKGET